MYLNKIKQLFNFKAINLTMYSFIVIPVIILSYLYVFNTNLNYEQMLAEPLLVAQLMIVLTYPFCYLLIKSIKENIDLKTSDCFIPLWIITIYQISSLNILTSSLMILVLYQTYGKKMLEFNKIVISNYSKSLLLGIIPLGLVYLLVLWVKYRLGLF